MSLWSAANLYELWNGISMKRHHDTTFTFLGKILDYIQTVLIASKRSKIADHQMHGGIMIDRKRIQQDTTAHWPLYHSIYVLCSISIQLRGVSHRFTTSSGSILKTIDLVKYSDSGHCRAQTDDPTRGYQFIPLPYE